MLKTVKFSAIIDKCDIFDGTRQEGCSAYAKPLDEKECHYGRSVEISEILGRIIASLKNYELKRNMTLYMKMSFINFVGKA